MSTTCLFRALKTNVGNSQRKLVLIVLADISNEENKCWPSHQYIAERAECSRRSVINHLEALEKAGFIHIQHRSKDNIKTSNVYTILNVQQMHNEESPDVQQMHKGSERDAQGGSERDAHNTPTLIKLPEILPSQEDQDSLFERFWEAYPKKTDRADALKAWKKKPRSAEFTNQLINDIRNRLTQGEWCTGKNKQYIPGGAPYLNGEKYNNEIIPRADFKPPTDFAQLCADTQDLTENF